MTLKQFLELALGLLLAYLFFASNLIFIIKWPLVISSILLGAGLAFFPVEDRPLDQWIINFVKAIYAPTRFTWQKTNKIPRLFLFTAHAPEVVNTVTKTIKAPQVSTPAPAVSDLSDAETTMVKSLDSLFSALPTSTPSTTPSPTPHTLVSKPSISIRKLKPIDSISPSVLNTPKTQSVQIPKDPSPTPVFVAPSNTPAPQPNIVFTAPTVRQSTGALPTTSAKKIFSPRLP